MSAAFKKGDLVKVRYPVLLNEEGRTEQACLAVIIGPSALWDTGYKVAWLNCKIASTNIHEDLLTKVEKKK